MSNERSATSPLEDLGVALSWGVGLPKELCILAATHVLAAIAGPDAAPASPPPVSARAAGGLLLAGPPHRLGLLVDFLLRPLEAAQRESLAMSETHDPARLADFLTEKNNLGIRGRTWAALAPREPGDDPPPSRMGMMTAVDRLRRPGVLLRNPDVSQMEALLSCSLGRSPLLVDERLDFAETLAVGDNCAIARGHAAWLAAALAGRHEAEGRDRGERAGPPRLHAVSASLLATPSPERLRRLLCSDEPELARILEHCIVAEVEAVSTGEPLKLDAALAGKWLDAAIWWQRAVGRALDVRVLGEPKIHLGPTGTSHLLMQRRLALDRIDKQGPAMAARHMWMAGLPDRLAWGLAMINFDGYYSDKNELNLGLMRAVYGVFSWTYERHSAAIALADKSLRAERLEMSKQRLLRALRRRGPCTWRELRRSLDIQAIGFHQPAIDVLKEEGTLQIEDGVFRLAGDAAQ